MTNWEIFKSEINEITEENDAVAVADGKPHRCSGIRCTNCDLYNTHANCGVELLRWLQKEYVEPYLFDKDELVEVSSNSKIWELRYFDRIDENNDCGRYFAFENGKTSEEASISVGWKYCRKYGTLWSLKVLKDLLVELENKRDSVGGLNKFDIYDMVINTINHKLSEIEGDSAK